MPINIPKVIILHLRLIVQALLSPAAPPCSKVSPFSGKLPGDPHYSENDS